MRIILRWGTLKESNRERGLPTCLRMVWLIIFSGVNIFPLHRCSSLQCFPTQILNVFRARSFALHLQMYKMRAWSFFDLLKSGTASGEEITSGWHERTQSPWQRFDLFLGCCQACSAHGDGVDRLLTGGRWTGSDLSLFLSLSLPSADPASGFDWISHELMRQAWRKASVVEISYHILICSLSEWCMRVILCCFLNWIKFKTLLRF